MVDGLVVGMMWTAGNRAVISSLDSAPAFLHGSPSASRSSSDSRARCTGLGTTRARTTRHQFHRPSDKSHTRRVVVIRSFSSYAVHDLRFIEGRLIFRLLFRYLPQYVFIVHACTSISTNLSTVKNLLANVHTKLCFLQILTFCGQHY